MLDFLFPRSLDEWMPTLPGNPVVDAWFYDVNALSVQEQQHLVLEDYRPGSVIVVRPGDNPLALESFPSARSAMARIRRRVGGIVVAGVGSSALGTAALARNVANTYDMEVAGIVSERLSPRALWELKGGAGSEFPPPAPPALEPWVNLMTPPWLKAMQTPETALPESPVISALERVLGEEPFPLRLLVGHSKGGLHLSRALQDFTSQHADSRHPYFANVSVVTVGAIADIPSRFESVHQYIGDADWLGAYNSKLNNPHKAIPGAWHHINTALPMHVSVERLLRKVPLAMPA